MLQILLLGGGAALAIAGELSAGGVIAASILGARAAAPIEGVIGSWRVAIAVRQAMERLGSLLGTSIPRLEGIALPRPTGRLLAERASVLLPNSQKLLFSGVSFRLAPGEQMAIIGPSGSGKSTLARAIIGLVPLATGNIRLDDVEVSAWRKRDLGRWIGYLPQTPIALMGSVSENIARLEPHADEEIIAAAREAGADAIIRSLPNGYDTPIGVGGVRLSGGQLQWVAIAGSLFGAPPLVVLDEPESHLDGDGETQLRSMLGRLRERQATVVIVSHRPAVVQVVDWLMVLRDGRAEFGQREEMMKRTLRISGSASG
jgi:ATP-binding cassette subfamily C protein/ATP-binding cassette subfamily C protein EexD